MILDGDELKEILVRRSSPIDRDELFELFESQDYLRMTAREFADVLIKKITNDKALAELADYLSLYKNYHIKE